MGRNFDFIRVYDLRCFPFLFYLSKQNHSVNGRGVQGSPFPSSSPVPRTQPVSLPRHRWTTDLHRGGDRLEGRVEDHV